MAAQIDYTSPNNYARSMDFSFTPTPSPLPGQREAFNTFNSDYTNFINAQETPTAIADRYSNKYNIPYLQEQAQNNNLILSALGNQIKALPGSVGSASGNSMLTAGQKDRVIQSQAAPLTQDFNTISANATGVNSALGAADANVLKAVGFEQADQMKKLTPWLQKYDAMTIMNAMENSQWSQTNSWELDRLSKNQAAGVTLSEGEQKRMYDLAAQEATFQAALDNIAATGDQERQTKKAPADLATLWKAMTG